MLYRDLLSSRARRLIYALALVYTTSGNAVAAATGRKLTGYECARMERLVVPMAELLGMHREDRYDVVLRWEQASDVPEAVNALMRFLGEYNDESLIRNQHDLLLQFTKDCKAGKIRVLMPKDPKTWSGYDSRALDKR